MNKYGLIGLKLGHSYSSIIHAKIFERNNIEANYELIELKEDELDSFMNGLRNSEYGGINVTIPYKEKVIPYLDFISDEVKEIKACNTIKIKDGKLYGYNTDYYGFIKQLEKYNINVENKDVYILGSGGASKALNYALKKLYANTTIVSRSGLFNYDSLKELKHIDMIVNATPLGMWPNVDESPIDLNIADKTDILVDIIFNPLQTKFLKLKDLSYNGLPMLIYQAIKAEEIWFDKNIEFDYDNIEEAIINE